MWCSWEAGNGLPGMTANYLAAMDALNQVKLALLGPCHSAPLQLPNRCLCLHGNHSMLWLTQQLVLPPSSLCQSKGQWGCQWPPT